MLGLLATGLFPTLSSPQCASGTQTPPCCGCRCLGTSCPSASAGTIQLMLHRQALEALAAVTGGMQERMATPMHGDTEISLTLVTIFRPANPTVDNVGDSVCVVKLSLARWVLPQPGHAAFLFRI